MKIKPIANKVKQESIGFFDALKNAVTSPEAFYNKQIEKTNQNQILIWFLGCAIVNFITGALARSFFSANITNIRTIVFCSLLGLTIYAYKYFIEKTEVRSDSVVKWCAFFGSIVLALSSLVNLFGVRYQVLLGLLAFAGIVIHYYLGLRIYFKLDVKKIAGISLVAIILSYLVSGIFFKNLYTQHFPYFLSDKNAQYDHQADQENLVMETSPETSIKSQPKKIIPLDQPELVSQPKEIITKRKQPDRAKKLSSTINSQKEMIKSTLGRITGTPDKSKTSTVKEASKNVEKPTTANQQPYLIAKPEVTNQQPYLVAKNEKSILSNPLASGEAVKLPTKKKASEAFDALKNKLKSEKTKVKSYQVPTTLGAAKVYRYKYEISSLETKNQ